MAPVMGEKMISISTTAFTQKSNRRGHHQRNTVFQEAEEPAKFWNNCLQNGKRRKTEFVDLEGNHFVEMRAIACAPILFGAAGKVQVQVAAKSDLIHQLLSAYYPCSKCTSAVYLVSSFYLQVTHTWYPRPVACCGQSVCTFSAQANMIVSTIDW